jgi:hypothetical protein
MPEHMIDGIEAFEKYQGSRLYSHIKFKQNNDLSLIRQQTGFYTAMHKSRSAPARFYGFPAQ